MGGSVHQSKTRLEAEVTVELAEQFRAVARAADRSTRGHLRHLIREHVIATTSETPAGGPTPREDTAGLGRNVAG